MKPLFEALTKYVEAVVRGKSLLSLTRVATADMPYIVATLEGWVVAIDSADIIHTVDIAFHCVDTSSEECLVALEQIIAPMIEIDGQKAPVAGYNLLSAKVTGPGRIDVISEEQKTFDGVIVFGFTLTKRRLPWQTP